MRPLQSKFLKISCREERGIFRLFIREIRQDLKTYRSPFWSHHQVQSCTSASSTSIISGGKAVDFAAFAAGVRKVTSFSFFLTLIVFFNISFNIDSLIDGVSCWMRSNNIKRFQTFSGEATCMPAHHLRCSPCSSDRIEYKKT